MQPLNARIETTARGRFHKVLFPEHRGWIPADGWYEWIKEPGDEKIAAVLHKLEKPHILFFAG
ncbi:SOS response-associated peptidase family protein [Pseudomonas versuta]|uniref:SOS response-associated peptidase family protein n=1 Tax=Pseudomonas versuta TaxID=1788301 RepID=UPI0015C57B45|nr:SOS response-associated peptidase family protein [Pseudomonas versuta]